MNADGRIIMKKYRKRLISMWIGIAVSAVTVFVPVTASEELVESGEERLYEEDESIQGEVIESGELVEPGIPATTPTKPEQTKPVQTTPEQTTPEQTTPEQTKPVQTTPEQTKPVQTTPEQTTPIQTTPEQTTPIQTTPEQTTPIQTTPEQTTPIQTTPEQTTPVQTTTQTETVAPTTEQTTVPETTKEEPIMVQLFNGKTLELQKDINESEVPDEFDIITYSYKGKEIEIAESKSGLILFYLKDDGDAASFYVYNEGKDSCIPFVKINSSSDQYIFLDLEEGSEELENLKATKISVNGKTLPAWKPVEGETPKEDYIVYLINKENVRSLYHVNITTGVIESYYGQSLDPADAESGESGSNEVIAGDSVLQEDTSDRDELLRKIAIFGGGAVGIIVLVIAGILLYRYLKKKIEQPEEEDDELYDDELYDEGEEAYEDDEEELDPDEEIERELAALEQEEWNKISQEENSTEAFQESEEENYESSYPQEEINEQSESEIDMESLNKAFNDLASAKEADSQSDIVAEPQETVQEEKYREKDSKSLKRNLERVLDDDDDFEVTDFRE